MRSYHSLKLYMIFVFLFLSLSLCWAKEEQKTTSPKDSVAKMETSAKGEVGKSDSSASDTTDLFTKAMDDFHEVLVPLWHEAYPKKDFKAIREQAPLFQKKLLVLLRAPLPNNLEKRNLIPC